MVQPSSNGFPTVISAGVYSHQLIGRSRELAFLAERARDVRHRGGAILVRGEAGIGKTRLVEEFVRLAHDAGVSVGTGTAREYANAPYAALTEALTSLRIGPIPPPSETGGDAKFAWYNSVADELHAAVAATPHGTVVILEDLHWADTATIDLLRFCSSRLATDPILFVATYRSDDIEADTARARAIAALERDAEVIPLNPLPPGQIEHLIAVILERIGCNVPLDVVAEIRDLADGRPLFAEELLRGVLERLERDGSSRPSVPTSIRATVRERYASLGPEARDVLLHAAVFGRRFSAQSVALLLGSDIGAIYASLRHARDLQLVVEDAQDDDRFAFRHALVREAIYSEMLRAEARVVHGRVASLLSSSPQADVSEVAEHAWHAGDGENAADWNERAGDLAVSVYAYAESARTYGRAFRSTADDSRRARVAQRSAESLYALGDSERSAEWFAHAVEASRRLGAASSAGRLRLRRARVLFELGRYDEGLAEADAIASGEDAADAAVRIEAETTVAGLLVARGRAVEALERLRNVDPHDTPLDPVVTTRFSATYAYALGLIGRADEARPRFEHAIAVAQSTGDDDMVLRTYNNWGSMEVKYGTLPRARELYAAALAIADATKNLRQTAWLALNGALAALLAADLDAAMKLLARGEEIGHGLPLVHRWTLAVKLRLMTIRGAADDQVLARAVDAFDAARRDGEQGANTSAQHILGPALAFHFAAAHATDEAERYTIAASSFGVAELDTPYWLIDAVARFGDRATRERARQRIGEVAMPHEAGPARGFLAMADAREALRRRNREEARALADVAVEAFRAAGWRLEEGFALETAGRAADALALFRSVGAHGEVRRLTQTASTQRRRGDETLTPREREIARLLVAGQTARSIADALVISERTVETHVAAVYRKLGVASRQELSALVSDATPT